MTGAWYIRTGRVTWASLCHSGFVGHGQECVVYFRFSRKPLEGFKQGNGHDPVYDVSRRGSDGKKPQSEMRPSRRSVACLLSDVGV